jgi:4-amino-4-deoxy-L-arabinose transferase-like glycosyltransferase
MGSRTPFGVGVLFAGAFSLVMPWLLAAVIAAKMTRVSRIRIGIFLLSLLLMFLTWLAWGNFRKGFMIGQAQSFSHRFPIAHVHKTGVELLASLKAGSLRTVPPPYLARGSRDVFVDKSELPEDIRGRFTFVSIRDGAKVFFAVTPGSGLLVGSPDPQRDGEPRVIQPGIYAYSTMR